MPTMNATSCKIGRISPMDRPGFNTRFCKDGEESVATESANAISNAVRVNGPGRGDAKPSRAKSASKRTFHVTMAAMSADQRNAIPRS